MNNFIVLICDMQVNSPITQTVIQITLFVDNQPKMVYTFFINLESVIDGLFHISEFEDESEKTNLKKF